MQSSANIEFKKGKQWKWRKGPSNHRQTSWSGETYPTLAACFKGAVSDLKTGMSVCGITPMDTLYALGIFDSKFTAAKKAAGRGATEIIVR